MIGNTHLRATGAPTGRAPKNSVTMIADIVMVL